MDWTSSSLGAFTVPGQEDQRRQHRQEMRAEQRPGATTASHRTDTIHEEKSQKHRISTGHWWIMSIPAIPASTALDSGCHWETVRPRCPILCPHLSQNPPHRTNLSYFSDFSVLAVLFYVLTLLFNISSPGTHKQPELPSAKSQLVRDVT